MDKRLSRVCALIIFILIIIMAFCYTFGILTGHSIVPY